MYTQHAHFVANAEMFDHRVFGMSPAEVRATDPSHRVLLQQVYGAVASAGHSKGALLGSATGMFLGICNVSDWGNVQRDDSSRGPGVFGAHGSDGGAAAGRVSYLFGLKGPCMSVNTACSSSLVAVDSARQNLRLGTCERSLVGGVCLHLHASSFVAFCALHALSRDGQCKTFDGRADGYGRSEACGAVLLELHDTTSTTIAGTSVNQDGRSASFMAPNGMSQEAVIRGAASGMGQLHTWLEAHGTGTALGDPIEIGALCRVLQFGSVAAAPAVVGAFKSQMAHSEGAAGMVGLVKVAYALDGRSMPPSLHLRMANARLGLEEFAVAVPSQVFGLLEGSVWMGVSSFGYSGTNSHAVVHASEVAVRETSSGPASMSLAVRCTQVAFEWCTVRASGVDEPLFGRTASIMPNSAIQLKRRAVVFGDGAFPRMFDGLFKAFVDDAYDLVVVSCPVGIPPADADPEVLAMVERLAGYSELPCVFVGLGRCAAWAHRVTACLEQRYTSATPVLLCAVCSAFCSPMSTIQTPILEVWTKDTSGESVNSEHRWSDTTYADCPSQATNLSFSEIVQLVHMFASPSHASESQIHDNRNELPAKAQVVVVGAGAAGLTVARRLVASGVGVCLLEQGAGVGGVWLHQANSTSRVNTSEPAYRLVQQPVRPNTDHSSQSEVLADMQSVASTLCDSLWFHIEVTAVHKSEDGACLVSCRDATNGTVEEIRCAAAVICTNRRLGQQRTVSFPGEERFGGTVCYGMGGEVSTVGFEHARVVIVGMGAFAVENTRTALEHGAGQITVLCRRIGAVCPLVVDYLNFVRPVDQQLRHGRSGSIQVLRAWHGLHRQVGAELPLGVDQGLFAPPRHTISVSDIWFLAHHYGMLDVRVATVDSLSPGTVHTSEGLIVADVLIKCVGYVTNTRVADMVGKSTMNGVGMIDHNLFYVAEPILDDVRGYQSPFGSSALQGFMFSAETVLRLIQDRDVARQLMVADPPRVPIGEFTVGDSMDGAAVLSEHLPEMRGVLEQQVQDRYADFHRRFAPPQFVAENAREWYALCDVLQQRSGTQTDPIPYPFASLVDSLKPEWLDLGLPVGNLASLPPELQSELRLWIEGSDLDTVHDSDTRGTFSEGEPASSGSDQLHSTVTTSKLTALRALKERLLAKQQELLSMPPGDRSVLQDQCDRLGQAIARMNTTLGIVPAAPLPSDDSGTSSSEGDPGTGQHHSAVSELEPSEEDTRALDSEHGSKPKDPISSFDVFRLTK
eukprot:TRINITY_DN8675_c0_g1_i4.p1 TRINITY_DN8675_c0_g1~~TRINITY_DN8675_c0_g1_i4.p1  ORF type:complete len:1250 (+),score=219.87 TRINITY_DN8675_c0_g1_i4:292-4041(+)